MQSFPLGYRLMDEDLNISFQRKLSFAHGPLSCYSPFFIAYEIGTINLNNTYTITGPENRIPYEIKMGTFRANFIVEDDWTIGNYRIIWKYQVCQLDPVKIASEDFEVTTCYSGGGSFGLIITLP